MKKIIKANKIIYYDDNDNKVRISIKKDETYKITSTSNELLKKVIDMQIKNKKIN